MELVVLAAGMGSRFGGVKQVAGVGPYKETLLEYALYDAINAGFSHVVFVIRKEIEEEFRQVVISKIERKISYTIVFQEIEDVPIKLEESQLPEKPWGTAHAILSAREAITGNFAVINADDYYGREAVNALAMRLKETSSPGAYTLIGYELEKTLSPFGGVNRGVCYTDENGCLYNVSEVYDIQKDHAGEIKGMDDAKQIRSLSSTTTVSMNLWGFTPDIFDFLEEKFASFLEENELPPSTEFLIQHVVSDLIAEDRVSATVIPTKSDWYGITHKEDLRHVSCYIDEATHNGNYPLPLWGDSSFA